MVFFRCPFLYSTVFTLQTNFKPLSLKWCGGRGVKYISRGYCEDFCPIYVQEFGLWMLQDNLLPGAHFWMLQNHAYLTSTLYMLQNLLRVLVYPEPTAHTLILQLFTTQ